MNQDEVDLIYEYLHENFTYKDGELLSNIKRGGLQKGSKFGSITHLSNGTIKIMCALKVNGKRYVRSLHQFIWLYFHKKIPSRLRHIDRNITNNRIENLTLDKANLVVNMNRTSKGYTRVKNGYCVNMGWYKSKQTYGVYSTEEIAKNVYKKVHLLRYRENLFHKDIKEIINQEFGNLKWGNQKEVKGYKFQDNLYQVRIRVNNKQKYIGSYHSPEEAHAAYLKAKEEYKNQKIIKN